MKRLALVCTLIAGGSGAWAADRQPTMDVRAIADGDSGSVWHAAEASMEPSADHARKGRAMRFRVEVDHRAGEPNYPIGWPRAYTNIPEEHRDWSRWDFVEFWLYADTSRERLPGSPLGFIVRSPDRNRSFHASLADAKKGEWVHFRFPVSSIPNRENCTAIQFFISEADYAHGDVVEFWVEDLQLSRYAEPTILAMQPRNKVLYADTRVLRLEVEMTGLVSGGAADVEVGLRRGKETIASEIVPLQAGVATIPLPVPAGSPGDYTVYARAAATGQSLTSTVRIVSSPWEEVQK